MLLWVLVSNDHSQYDISEPLFCMKKNYVTMCIKYLSDGGRNLINLI